MILNRKTSKIEKSSCKGYLKKSKQPGAEKFIKFVLNDGYKQHWKLLTFINRAAIKRKNLGRPKKFQNSKKFQK